MLLTLSLLEFEEFVGLTYSLLEFEEFVGKGGLMLSLFEFDRYGYGFNSGFCRCFYRRYRMKSKRMSFSLCM
jgi:hypothetical protein